MDSPYAAASTKGVIHDAPGALRARDELDGEAAQGTGWSHLYRTADALGGAGPKRPIVFECVGVPGIIDGIIAAAPLTSRVVVVGVCMGDDKLRPALANGKEIDLRFVFGYTPLEFRDSLHMLADGKLDAAPWSPARWDWTASPRRSTNWSVPRRTPRSSSIPAAPR